MDHAIETKQLSVGYGERLVLPEFSVELEKGSITAIIGANGCGKSTLLKAVGRIISSQAGKIFLENQDLSSLRTRDIAQQLAILPQSPQTPAGLTCGELVAYGRFPYQSGLGRLSKKDRQVIEWALAETGMTDFYDRPVADLSGGQCQRIWIAMALAQETNTILLDEPTTYLDLCHQLEVLDLLQRLNREKGTTIVMVLHDLNLASRYSDSLLVMKEGATYAHGRPEEVFTARMLADCFAIDGEVQLDQRYQKPICVSYGLLEEDQKEEEK